jgi:hypothetical protein
MFKCLSLHHQYEAAAFCFHNKKGAELKEDFNCARFPAEGVTWLLTASETETVVPPPNMSSEVQA